jgi:hypothetical protein
MMILLILLTLSAPAVAQEIKSCPAEFPIEAVKIGAPAGWVGVAPQRLLLSGADVVEGEPGNGALIGKRRKTRAGHDVVYDEIGGGNVPLWLACRYGDLALAERLPATTDRCIVSYRNSPDGGNDIAVTCKPVK